MTEKVCSVPQKGHLPTARRKISDWVSRVPAMMNPPHQGARYQDQMHQRNGNRDQGHGEGDTENHPGPLQTVSPRQDGDVDHRACRGRPEALHLYRHFTHFHGAAYSSSRGYFLR